MASRREKREMLIVIEGKNNADVAVNSFSDSVDKSTKKVKGMSTGLKSLDGQIKTTEKTIKELRAEIHRTGDVELFKDLDKQVRRQQALLKKTRLLGADDGEEAASGFFAGFSQRIGPLMLRAPVGPPLLGAVAAAAPLIASTLSAAVTAGVGAVPIAAGIAIAAKDSAVGSAAEKLAGEIATDLRDAAAPFQGVLLKALGRARVEFRKLKPEIDALFEVGAQRTLPLVDSAIAGIDRLVPKLRQANDNADPVFDTFNEHLPIALETTGDALVTLSEDSDNAARALDSLLTAAEVTIAGTAGVIGTLNKIGPFVSGPLYALGDLTKESGDSAEDAGENYEDYATAIDAARVASDKMLASLTELNKIQLSANDAERAFQEAIDAAKDAYDGKVKRLNLGTEKGREYSAALDAIASSALDSAQAIYDTTGSQEAANQKIKEGRDALYAQARAFGLSEKDARSYVDSVLAIPKQWTTKVSAEVQQAKAALLDTKDILLSLRSRKLTVTVVQKMIKDNDYTGIARGYEEGGEITELPGPRGKDSGFIRAARGEYVLDTDTVDAAGGARAIDRWRRDLKAGPGYAAPRTNPYRPAGAGAASMASSGTLPVAVAGAGTAGRGFAALFHEMLRNNDVQLVVRDGPLRGTRIGVG